MTKAKTGKINLAEVVKENVLADATYYVGGKKVKEGRFFKEISRMLHPPKKRVVVIDTVKKLLAACPDLQVFGEEIKKYVITKGGRLMLWEDWYKKPHPLISKTEEAEFYVIETKRLVAIKIPEPEEFFDDDDFNEDEIEFTLCSKCDGNDACHDFGCACEMGLGRMVQKNLPPGIDEWS